MAESVPDWRVAIEEAFPEVSLPGEEFADHFAIAEFTKYLQARILARDLEESVRVFDWIEPHLETPSELQRLLAIHLVMMIHLVGMTHEERLPFVQGMPPHFFRIWHGANQTLKSSELK